MRKFSCSTDTIQISEDGGSLNLSKRSLADTSVTSTADLSIFSGGDRRPGSQQQCNYDLDMTSINDKLQFSSDNHLHNNNKNDVGGYEGDDNGESSPK